MKLPRRFFQPLAAGAPEPFRELPIKLERMIHFVPPHNEKVRARVPELAKTVDVVLGNLEDAVPADQKEAARNGFVAMAKATDFAASGTGLWTRINALNSPWILDDLFTLVAEVGDRLDVVMVPKVEARGTSTTSTSCSPSSRRVITSRSRSSSTPSSRRRRAWPTSMPSPAQAPACTA